MRTALALLIAGLSCASARAEPPSSKFVLGAASINHALLPDLGTIQTEGDLKVARVLMVGRKDEVVPGVTDKVTYALYSRAYNCQKKTQQLRSAKLFNASGELISDDDTLGNVEAVIPNTTQADILALVCRGEAPERNPMSEVSAAVQFGRSFLLTVDRMPANKK